MSKIRKIRGHDLPNAQNKTYFRCDVEALESKKLKTVGTVQVENDAMIPFLTFSNEKFLSGFHFKKEFMNTNPE